MKTSTLARCADLAGQVLMVHPLWSAGLSFTSAIALTMLYLGGWQLLSFLLHCVLSEGGRHRRKAYGFALGTIGLFILLTGLTEMNPASGFTDALIVTCCSMGVWYFAIGIFELRSRHLASVHRREIHWKL